ncbi:hypothetical protein SNE40_015875 [Patella caerulea]|uniref:Uncharacterized protein n=2 Tax=Patella caerulea TaxID=87958 RepID=A0AAN8JAU8_PATCE
MVSTGVKASRASLTFSSHIEGQVNKANRVMGLIRRSYEYLDSDSFRRLFTALVHSHLEYCNIACLEKDKKLIEGVLRRGIKLISGLKDLSYEERLEKLKIPSMAFRRARGDVIEAYKYTHGLYKTDQILELDTDNTRGGHSYKLRHCKTATRVVNTWNSLPEDVVSAPSLNAFNSKIDRLWSDHVYKIKLPSPLPHAKTKDQQLKCESARNCSLQATA